MDLFSTLPGHENLDLTNKKVLQIVTLNRLNLYATYDPNKTTVSKVINAIFDNYDCKNFSKKDLQIYSEQLRAPLCDFSEDFLMKDFDCPQMTQLIIRKKPETQEQINETNKKNRELIMRDSNRLKQIIGGDMQISIRSLTGKSTTIDIQTDYSVYDIKLLIQYKEGIPPGQIRLLFAGKQLENDQTISSYNIQRDAILHMVLMLRGGMYHETSGRAGNYKPLESCIFNID
jgi:hypothetical protein